MYETFWNLKRRPFDDGAAPDFYYPGRTHQAALLKLRYAIDQRKGVGLLAGEHGLGKTFITHVLEQDVRSEGIGPFFRLVFPQLSPSGTLAYLAARLGADVTSHDADDRILRALEDRLTQLHGEQRHVVFLIDDAHLLDLPHLHLLRLLLNLREEGVGDFTLLLSGRTEILARLQGLAALDQRTIIRAVVEPLPAEEVLPYLQRRLAVAGRADVVFSAGAGQAIWELTQGIPRRINQLCDLALLVGYVDELGTIDTVEIEAAAEELMSIAA